ncbi:GntR family transcriptional regulator [Solirhodobacter olei]|uniref:GntR family transcriptional regulator n=1 Tax=Solirhodobacter olei TaxID=2493082 RepID=UPI000FD967E1|nr:GntR family transcriptional regulator [Solirhodobacter olei]
MDRAADLKETHENGDEITEGEIVERLFEAVMERRLPPGTKLSESALCEAFGVGRMRIRRCLLLLASRDVVELRSNRGAFVASPTADQAREVFEARLAIEPAIARMVTSRATAAQIAALEEHIHDEVRAQQTGSRHEAIRLSGQFHVRLAEAAGNGILVKTMKELVTLTSLILGIYGASGTTPCRDHDHVSLIDAIRGGDGDKAALIMREHLADIEASTDLSIAPSSVTNLAAILRRP